MTIIPSITPVIGKFDPEDLLDVEEETLYDDTINLLLVQQNAHPELRLATHVHDAHHPVKILISLDASCENSAMMQRQLHERDIASVGLHGVA